MKNETQVPENDAQERLRVLYSLSRLPDEVRSGVIADKEIVERFNFKLTSPLTLKEGLTIDQHRLFDAFTEACNELATGVPFTVDEDQLVGQVRIDADGSGVLEIDGHIWRFRYAGLLDSRREIRVARLNEFMAEITLGSSTVAKLEECVLRDEMSHDCFFEAVRLLESSPEHFVAKLVAKVSPQKVNLAESDLLPENIQHWENLAPLPAGSASLQEFLEGELKAEEKSREALDRKKLFRWRALLCGSPDVVPHNLFAEWPDGDVLGFIRDNLPNAGHFSLLSAFEVCARSFKRDSNYVELGERILEETIGDIDRLKRRCEVFATAFILATARLATHEDLRTRPAFWRRVVAVGHAEITCQGFSASHLSADQLLEWGLGLRGHEFVLSVRNDLRTDPRWMPEWIAPEYLMADVLGRLRGACLHSGWEDTPESWKRSMEKLEKWIAERKVGLQTMFPAVLQGSLESQDISALNPDIQKMMAEQYGNLASSPSAENLALLMQWVETIGVRPESDKDVLTAVMAIRSNSASLDNTVVKVALSTAARIAVIRRNVQLAEAVAETLLNFSRGVLTTATAYEVVFVLLECSATWPDRETSRKVLAKQLEQLAFLLPKGDQSAALAEIVGTLQSLDEELALLLGRAMSCALLAANAVGANDH